MPGAQYYNTQKKLKISTKNTKDTKEKLETVKIKKVKKNGMVTK